MAFPKEKNGRLGKPPPPDILTYGGPHQSPGAFVSKTGKEKNVWRRTMAALERKKSTSIKGGRSPLLWLYLLSKDDPNVRQKRENEEKGGQGLRSQGVQEYLPYDAVLPTHSVCNSRGGQNL